MENNYLDQFIKTKLQQLDVEYQAETWDALEQKLGLAEDATQLDDPALDGIIVHALEDYEVPYTDDWADFSQRLDDDIIDATVLGALESMEVPAEDNHWAMLSERLDEEVIDGTVLGALSTLEVPYEEGSWAAMSERLDNEILDDTVFDALDNLSVAYNESHWVAMSERLDAIFARPFEIIRYKLLELALLFLLFAGVGQYIPADIPKMDVPVAEQSEEVKEQTSEQVVPSYQDAKDVAKNEQATNISSDNTKEKVSETATNPIQAAPKSAAQNSNTEKRRKTIPTPHASTKVPALVMASSKKEETKETKRISSSNEHIEKEDKIQPQEVQGLSSLETPNIDELNVRSINEEKIDELVATNFTSTEFLVSDIPFLNKKREKDLNTISLINIQNKKKATIRVGMFAAANADFIFTPYDPILGLEAYRQSSPGYGGGISLGWKHSRWEVETAISYMAKRYNNRPFIHIFDGGVVEGYQANFLTGIELNIINIPLHFNYHIINKGKWYLYGLTGGTMQVVLQANYDANREQLGGVGTSFTGGTKVSEDNTKSLFSRKDFNSGFLIDKQLKENSYYSIDIGMGLERYISPYWNIFIQPTYQYNLPEIINTNGLGPNNDKINTFQILIGVKSNLN